MARMVKAAVAGDVAEAEEMQAILRNAGIDSVLEADELEETVTVMVAEDELDAAQDAIEALTEPDELTTD